MGIITTLVEVAFSGTLAEYAAAEAGQIAQLAALDLDKALDEIGEILQDDEDSGEAGDLLLEGGSEGCEDAAFPADTSFTYYEPAEVRRIAAGLLSVEAFSAEAAYYAAHYYALLVPFLLGVAERGHGLLKYEG